MEGKSMFRDKEVPAWTWSEPQTKFWEERDAYEKAMREELLRIQCEGEDRGYIYAGRIDFKYSRFWFKVETEHYGRIHSHYFACKTIGDLKRALEWIINETKFYDATAFVEGGSYVTFYGQQDIDLLFDKYYGSYYERS